MSDGHSILQKVQQAFRSVISDAALSFSPTVVCGISRGANAGTDEEELAASLPMIVCDCRNASLATDQSIGTWTADVSIALHESADDTTEVDHLAHSGLLSNLMLDDTLASMLSGSTDFTCFLALIKQVNYELSGRRWVFRIELECEVAGYDIN